MLHEAAGVPDPIGPGERCSTELEYEPQLYDFLHFCLKRSPAIYLSLRSPGLPPNLLCYVCIIFERGKEWGRGSFSNLTLEKPRRPGRYFWATPPVRGGGCSHQAAPASWIFSPSGWSRPPSWTSIASLLTSLRILFATLRIACQRFLPLRR
jgi:hypothetical protein